MNMGQPAFATMGLVFTADGQTTTSTTLVVNGWVTLTNPTNLIYVGCSINGLGRNHPSHSNPDAHCRAIHGRKVCQ